MHLFKLLRVTLVFLYFLREAAYLLSSRSQGPEFNAGTISSSCCCPQQPHVNCQARNHQPAPRSPVIPPLFYLESCCSFRVTNYSRCTGKAMLYNFYFLTEEDGLVKKVLKTGKTFRLIERFNFFIYLSSQMIPCFLCLLLPLCTVLR